MKYDWIDKANSILIVGRKRSGKTALAYKLLENSKKPVYVYGNPKPELIRALGYDVLYSLEDLERCQNITLWIDEVQLFLKHYDKTHNSALQRLLSISAHRDITIILSTSDTRFINKALESYIDVWLVKDIEVMLVKRGSMIKNIIRKYALIDEEGFRLNNNEYIVYSINFQEINGRFTFKLPNYFTEEHSKPFRIANESANEIKNKVRIKLRK